MRFATAFWTLLALLSVAAPPSTAPAAAQQSAPSLQALLDRFGEMPGMSAEFREEKRIALLAVPVRSQGVLYFAPPGKLMRQVTSPSPSYALLEGGTLTFASQGERQVLQVNENPVVAGFVQIFRFVLAGDRSALERTYHVDYETDGARWTLTLKPKNEALGRFLDRMVLEGEGYAVERMTMTEVSGDTTVTEFSNVNPRRRFTPTEQRRLFRVP